MVKFLFVFLSLFASTSFAAYSPTLDQGAAGSTAWPVSQPDLVITGQGTQTVVGNNILLAAAGTTSVDASGYRSASVQVNSTGTAGTFIFENSNDGTNFVAMPVYNAALTTTVPIAAAITATNSQIIYTFPIRSRYIRVRIATTITGGSLQAFSRISQESWSPAVQAVGNSTAANFLATVSGSLTSAGTVSTVSTVSSVTSSQAAVPGIIADVASAAIITTTTTATLTPTFGATYKVSIPVTAVSGTTPTLDISIEESADTGTNWYKVYDFPRITATGFYHSPVIPLTGNRIRYVQTVTGTSPSFTRAINRLQSSWTSADRVRQLIDRTIVLTTLNSTTPSIYVAGTGNVDLVVNIGAATLAPVLQIEGSEDNATWYSVGSTLSAVASSTVKLSVSNQSTFLRARVSTAGTTVTAGYVLLKAY